MISIRSNRINITRNSEARILNLPIICCYLTEKRSICPPIQKTVM